MINQYGFRLGVVGMNDADIFATSDDGFSVEPPINDIGDMDLTKVSTADANKKMSHNFKRVLQKSPARSIAAAATATIVISGALFYSLGSSGEDAKAGRDYLALDTVSFDYNETGRDQLTQAQVDHIQTQGENKARSAATNSESYTPQFSDVIATTVEQGVMTDGMSSTQVTFEGVVKGGDYVKSSEVRDASFANSINYSSSPTSADGKVNYASGPSLSMPAPAAKVPIQSEPLPMEQGAGSPDANYQTNDGAGGGGNYDSSGGGDFGGMGGPNPTGIDPGVESLRQSLEDDFNQQSQYDEQYRTEQDQRLAQQQQYIQQETQMRQQATSQSVQQQQQGFAQPSSSMDFTAATYIQKKSPSSGANNSPASWNNDIGSVAIGATANNAVKGEPEKEEVKNLASHIVRVGTTWNVVVENEVNTDNGTTVFARALSGPYAGSRLIGTINSAGIAGRSAGVVFETLIPERRNKNAIPIRAVGMTLGDLDTNISTSVNRHFLQRYSALIAQGITGGYGEAYSGNTGVTSQVINPDGSVTTVSNKEQPDSKEIRGQVIGQLGSELQGEFSRVRARPATFTVARGTPLTIMFVENVDNKTASTTSIRVNQGNFSNTSSYGMQPRNN